MVTKWEYHVIGVEDKGAPEQREILNKWGAAGWELVGVAMRPNRHLLYLKKGVDRREKTMFEGGN